MTIEFKEPTLPFPVDDPGAIHLSDSALSAQIRLDPEVAYLKGSLTQEYDSKARLGIIENLITIGERSPRHIFADGLLETLTENALFDSDLSCRVATVQGLKRLVPTDALKKALSEIITGSLDSQSFSFAPEVAAVAIDGVESLEGRYPAYAGNLRDHFEGALLSIIDSVRTEPKIAIAATRAVHTLTMWRSRDLNGMLPSLLASPISPSVKAEAIKSVYDFRRRDLIPALSQLMRDPSPIISAAARNSFAMLQRRAS